MQVSQKLQVDAKSFFDALAGSVAYDISQATGKKVSPGQIYPGYRYKKKMKNKVGRSGDVNVTIKQFQSPSVYEAVFKSAQGTNFICYEIESEPSGGITVHYKEGFEGDGMIKSLNYKFVSVFYNPGGKKRVVRTLKSMEQFIKSKKSDKSDS